jgi:hypothetical protein
MEVIVSTIIATIAVIALAYSFGAGRGLVNRYELARMALAAAQRRMELLEAAGDTALVLAVPSTHGPQDVDVDGRPVLRESWTVTPYHDAASKHAGSTDLKKVTVTVAWGGRSAAETIQLTRLFHVR